MLLCVWLSSQVGHTDVHIGLFDWCMLLHIIAFCYLSSSFIELLFNIQSICKLSFHVTCFILWIHNKTVYSVHTHHINKEMQFGVKKNCFHVKHLIRTRMCWKSLKKRCFRISILSLSPPLPPCPCLPE